MLGHACLGGSATSRARSSYTVSFPTHIIIASTEAPSNLVHSSFLLAREIHMAGLEINPKGTWNWEPHPAAKGKPD